MNTHLERFRSRPPATFASLDSCYEQVYHLPSENAFKTVNSAVFYVLSRFECGVPLERDEVDGGAVYYLLLNDWLMQLFVLHIAETVAAIRLHACVQLDDLAITGRAYLWRPKGPNEPFMEGAQAIVGAIHDSIVTSLRYAVSYEPSTAPPMPPKSDLQAICTWQQIYAPAKPLQELAKEIGVSYSAPAQHPQRPRPDPPGHPGP
jgi:hypothetical protein